MGNWGVFSHPLECLLPLLIFLVFGATILPWHLQTPYIGSTPGPHRGCNHQHHDLTMFFSSKSQTKSSFATGILGGVWGTPIQSIHHVHWFFFSKKADENRTPGLMNWFFGDFLHSSQHECCYQCADEETVFRGMFKAMEKIQPQFGTSEIFKLGHEKEPSCFP